MRKSYKIYPGIGIARIGNSNQYFIGPESPYKTSVGPFKDGGKIKKQAARFRIYEFEVDEFGRETIVGEIVESADTRISWGVHLVNRKAASRTVPEDTGIPRNPGYDQEKLVIEGRDAIEGAEIINQDIVGEIQFIRNNRLEGRDDVPSTPLMLFFLFHS